MGGMIEERKPGLMSRLATNRRGNVLGITAAAAIPLIGMIGGAVDLSRMYIVKTRLQHACDAGALAGRKAMGGGKWSQNNGTPNKIALQFFDGNFKDRSYGSEPASKSFAETSGTVNGTASAWVPMTLTRVLGFSRYQMTVNCDATMQLPNTDVMFVLDMTDSMLDTLSGDSGTKITALRKAVKCFYEIVAIRDSNADCDGAHPSGGVGSDVQVRFGFVPFSTNVNVGGILPASYFSDNWTYPARAPVRVYGLLIDGSWTGNVLGNPAYGPETVENNGTVTNGKCSILGKAAVFTLREKTTENWPDVATEIDVKQGDNFQPSSWTGYVPAVQKTYTTTITGSTCKETSKTRNVDAEAKFRNGSLVNDNGATTVSFPGWTYKQVSLTVSALKAGTTLPRSIDLPIGTASGDHGSRSVQWDGCIQERGTKPQANYDPIPAEAWDLKIDDLPVAGDTKTQWHHALQGAFLPRREPKVGSNGNLRPDADTGSFTSAEVTNFLKTGFTVSWPNVWACPSPAQKLQVWNDPTKFDGYVDGLTTGWGTHHNIGLLWGARLISQTGIFKADNEATPTGGAIQRTIVYMTDGEACTDTRINGSYGAGFYDRRETDPAVAPTAGCGGATQKGTLTAQIEVKTEALCRAINNMPATQNLSLYVVYFGQPDGDTETRMKNCALPGHFFQAQNGNQLLAQFKIIAGKVQQLRLTK